MAIENSCYSPNILIYLEVGEKTIRLADVLCDTATLYESIATELPPGTPASLVFRIGSDEERQDVVLREGISMGSKLVSFSSLTEVEPSDFEFSA